MLDPAPTLLPPAFHIEGNHLITHGAVLNLTIAVDGPKQRTLKTPDAEAPYQGKGRNIQLVV